MRERTLRTHVVARVSPLPSLQGARVDVMYGAQLARMFSNDVASPVFSSRTQDRVPRKEISFRSPVWISAYASHAAHFLATRLCRDSGTLWAIHLPFVACRLSRANKCKLYRRITHPSLPLLFRSFRASAASTPRTVPRTGTSPRSRIS